MSKDGDIPKIFRANCEAAERKFSRVRDAPLHPYAATGPQSSRIYHKVFKAYMNLWKFQQLNRAELVGSGLQRWEIGEIASRIGQLYFNQYLRTSELRFLLEAYIFYEAIYSRRYFDGSWKDRRVRFKELRFYARFLMVALILRRIETVKVVVERFKEVVHESRVSFKDINFREWKLVVQEISGFIEAELAVLNARPLRYAPILDSFPSSLPYVARYHARRLLKFEDAVLTSYHKNEMKFAELTLDTFRMMQCLEWEPSGSSYQKARVVEPRENGGPADQSLTSGFIDVNMIADMADPNLPPNPKKAVLYHPSVTQLIAVIATVCEQLPPDNVVLIYLSASGSSGQCSTLELENSTISRNGATYNATAHNRHEQTNGIHENQTTANGKTNHYFENYLLLGPSKGGGPNSLFPGDIIPFTRRPLFLIIDSDTSHAFKVLHGAERGETAALFLSPLKSSFRNTTAVDLGQQGSQFTFFLTSPLQAFCQLVDYHLDNDDLDMNKSTESILSSALSIWEEILCTSRGLNIVWAQLLSDPFLRRLILRFIFCRGVLTLFSRRENDDQSLPICIPELPSTLAANSTAVQPAIIRLANHLKVADTFKFL